MPETPWYIRSRGRISGPFTEAHLESMRERGQFSRFHEVSTDRQNWVIAARVPALFPPAEASQPASASESYSVGGSDLSAGEAREQPFLALPASDDAGSSWFYAREGTHHGPVSYEELRRMAAQGEIGAETLLWKTGMADWVACRSFPDLVSLSESTESKHTAPYSTQSHSGYGFAADPQYLPSTSGLAVASLVLGILCLCGVGSLLATIFGAVALAQIEKSNGRLTGKGMAIAGLIMGIIGLGLFAFLFFHGMVGSAFERMQGRLF